MKPSPFKTFEYSIYEAVTTRIVQRKVGIGTGFRRPLMNSEAVWQQTAAKKKREKRSPAEIQSLRLRNSGNNFNFTSDQKKKSFRLRSSNAHMTWTSGIEHRCRTECHPALQCRGNRSQIAGPV